MKVLVVDSDWRFAQEVSRQLEPRAHLVVHEAGPQQGMARAEHWQPELIILSAEASQKLPAGAIKALAPRPAILLTGWLDRYDLLWKAWQSVGDEVLIKPVFHASDLHSAVITAMENAAAGTRGIPITPARLSA